MACLDPRTRAAAADPTWLQEAPVVGGRGEIASRHATELDARGAAMLLSKEGNGESDQPLGHGAMHHQNDGDFEVLAGLVMQRPGAGPAVCGSR